MTRALTDNLDPELPVVEAILMGDRAAFEEFVRRQGKWVRSVIFGASACVTPEAELPERQTLVVGEERNKCFHHSKPRLARKV